MANIEKNPETWKEIEGFEGRYLISDLGNVMSVYVGSSNTQYYDARNYNKLLKQHLYQSKYRARYLFVALRKNGIRTTAYIHRLKAAAFVPNPENKPFVNHIDGNSLNNDISNLEWSTPMENIRHAWDNGLCKTNRISAEVIEQVKTLHTQGLSQYKIAKIIGFDQSCISRILNKKRSYHVA